MPRPAKGARLWLRPEARDAGGRITRRAAWYILDRGRQFATGCAQGEIGRAESALASHIERKYQTPRRQRDPDHVPVADILNLYVDDRSPPEPRSAKRLLAAANRLSDHWQGKSLAEVRPENCRAYVAGRSGRTGGARRDLEVLRAAINHHAAQGLHRGAVMVDLPARGAPRQRWLTRDEAARLLWVCWRTREVQTLHRGRNTGEKTETRKYPLRHLARFILIGLYTGSRAGAIAAASPYASAGRSYVDLDRGIFYRLAEGKRVTLKRQPPAPIPPRLLAHMRRWRDREIIAQHMVEWAGLPVRTVRTAFRRAAMLAGLMDKETPPAHRVTPHTLRHTAVTWLMQQGVSIWEAGGYVGMSPSMVERTYGHHHPDHLRRASLAITNRPGTVNVSSMKRAD